MQSVKPLLLVLLTYCLLSCETKKPAIVTTASGETSPCGDTLVGVTTETREFQVAGATLNDFKLGNLNTKVTPEFQRIASEAAMNEDSRVKTACKLMRMSGDEPSGEMLSYNMQLLGFLGSNPPPTVEERMAWAAKVPVPKTKIPQPPEPRHTNTGIGGSVEFTIPLSIIRLAQSCKQPIVGLRRQPEEFFPLWYGFLGYLKKEKFPQDRDLLNLYQIKGGYRDPRYNTLEDFFQNPSTL